MAAGWWRSFQDRSRRWAGLPERDDWAYDGVMRWRTAVVVFVEALPVMTASTWLVTRAMSAFVTLEPGLADLGYGAFLAGECVVLGWPWVRDSQAWSRRWPYWIVGWIAVLVGTFGAGALVEPATATIRRTTSRPVLGRSPAALRSQH